MRNDYSDYERYMMSQPMRDGEEIRDFFDSLSKKEDEQDKKMLNKINHRQNKGGKQDYDK